MERHCSMDWATPSMAFWALTNHVLQSPLLGSNFYTATNFHDQRMPHGPNHSSFTTKHHQWQIRHYYRCYPFSGSHSPHLCVPWPSWAKKNPHDINNIDHNNMILCPWSWSPCPGPPSFPRMILLLLTFIRGFGRKNMRHAHSKVLKIFFLKNDTASITKCIMKKHILQIHGQFSFRHIHEHQYQCLLHNETASTIQASSRYTSSCTTSKTSVNELCPQIYWMNSHRNSCKVS